ncbi:exonuclease 3'-5' domain-containing protein 2-like [Hyalella azteca]|uniref:Exonuclease 3'-5' domain-containing protein 2-like n=2 Tax=Hyalella azteca TaxID=294128 RepID=A0A979FV95_HYAAZ|nr:exonuclease 3'-5' domain-containing protein 2-like [Hyalella azteca]
MCSKGKTALVASAALTVGVGGYYLFQNKQSISWAIWKWRLNRCVHSTTRRVVVVADLKSWANIEKELLSSSYSLGCIGFDCEWVTGTGIRRPVALVQLATHTGLCVLVRLSQLTDLSEKFLDLLRDPMVLKIGVGCAEDCKLLLQDRGIVVNGAVDLRIFFASNEAVKEPKKKRKKKKCQLSGATNDGKDNIENHSDLNGSKPDTSCSIPTKIHESFDKNSNNSSTDPVRLKDITKKLNCDNLSTPTGKSLNKRVVTNSLPNEDVCLMTSKPLPVTMLPDKVSKSTAVADLPSTVTSNNNPRVSFVGLKGPAKLGLSALAEHYLKRSLDKDWRVRASDWEAEHLSHRQICYAAEDARSGLHVFLVILELLVTTQDIPSLLSMSLLSPLCSWSSATRNIIFYLVNKFHFNFAKLIVDFHACCGMLSVTNYMLWYVKDVVFTDGWMTASSKKHPKTINSENNNQQQKSKGYRRAYSLRKSPLYHNSVLWAPDNEPLCTVDPKKAYWYVDNDLGEVVQEDPLIVRLNFEPTGRPQKEGADGYFYLNERQNVCVVCGKDESYIRKNVVPHEYRKYFPEILKSHQNHDVVLLCTECHQLSNQLDGVLRYQLADQHDAPIGNSTDVKVITDGDLKVIKSAGKALLKKDSQIPPTRIAELRKTLQDYFKTDLLTDEMIAQAAELDVSIFNVSYEPHGLRVFKYYEKIGLIHFEKLWRENFLTTMKPKFMPKGWSVTHNHEKLKLKMSRHALDDPVREQYRIALVGTDGTVDVPYVPNLRKPQGGSDAFCNDSGTVCDSGHVHDDGETEGNDGETDGNNEESEENYVVTEEDIGETECNGKIP